MQRGILKSAAIACVIAIALTLQGCVATGNALTPYIDSLGGFKFLYPVGWVQVDVSSGPAVVFHDLIEETENVSVVVAPVPDGQTLDSLGTPSEVGYQLSKSAIAPPDSGRQAELVNAETREASGKTYYLLEYEVQLPGQRRRHNLASVAISRGKLFTFNVSTPERRWSKAGELLSKVARSFSVD